MVCGWAEQSDNNSCNDSIFSCRLHRCLKQSLNWIRIFMKPRDAHRTTVCLSSQREKEIIENQNNDIYMCKHTWIWTVLVCVCFFFLTQGGACPLKFILIACHRNSNGFMEKSRWRGCWRVGSSFLSAPKWSLIC